MDAQKTSIAGCWIIKPKVFKDARGYFYESFQKESFEALTKIAFNPIQDNEVFSTYGVVRGLHLQAAPHAQAKLIRVLQGTILDVVVDLRKESPTFGAVFTAVPSQENKEQLFVPKGCAHGYSVLSPEAVVFYKTDAYYHPETESGILYNDTKLNIDWGIPEEKQILSDKDLLWPTFKNYSL
ncbi:dTDP-4-dehydrorhamnose 3,5-epimerase [Flavobacteriaceae bacterium]|nr:dTDP-4-dehydrorhamnose 3,5-epimerase [Flavobacteriaceae bacterium]